MAIYHFSAQILSRRPRPAGDGQRRPGSSAVAAAAYRSGERLTDERAGRAHDYSNRKGIAHSEILLPEGAAPWLADRSALWNTVESMETRRDAQLAREINVALPHELSHEQRIELVRGFVMEHFVSRGMVADIALHDPSPEKGTSDKNFHAHIMLTLRQALPGGEGLHPVKTREWNSRDLLAAWRGSWAEACNEALKGAGRKERVDHRTLVAQRDRAEERGDWKEAAKLNRAPEIHVGPNGREARVRGWEQQSRDRNWGPSWHYVPATAKKEKRTGYRVVRYPSIDRGPRLSWLEEILAGNNQQLRRDLVKIDRQAARFRRKIDFWGREASFWASGHILGAEYRYKRWQAAKDDKERRRIAEQSRRHAQMRQEQLARLLRRLEDMLTGGKGSREAVLRRQRQVAGWREAGKARSARHNTRGAGRGRSR